MLLLSSCFEGIVAIVAERHTIELSASNCQFAEFAEMLLIDLPEA